MFRFYTLSIKHAREKISLLNELIFQSVLFARRLFENIYISPGEMDKTQLNQDNDNCLAR